MSKLASLSRSILIPCTILTVACDDQTTEQVRESVERESVEEAKEPSATAPPSAPMPDNPATPGPLEERAKAELKSADGEAIGGEVEFQATADGVRIVATIEDAAPGKHGFHIHEKDDCSDIAKKSIGGHFDREKQAHALPSESAKHHLGDLGTIEVDDDGEARLEITIEGANLKPGDQKSLLGRAVVVHKGEDVGKAKQPSGDSGIPIACGPIRKS
jgi:Cu-Zn family superoxide dismutase